MNEEQRLNAGLVKPTLTKPSEEKTIANIFKPSIHHLH